MNFLIRARRSVQRLSRLYSCLALLFFLVGCGPLGGETTVLEECVLPTDQRGTLNGRWTTAPIPLAFQAQEFSREMQLAIIDAAEVWNQFYLQSKGYSVFRYGSREEPYVAHQAAPSDLCSSRIVSATPGDAFYSAVTLRNPATWSHSGENGEGNSVVALTSLCPGGWTQSANGMQIRSFTNAQIQLNTDHFFGNGQKKPDLTSTFVHELGHLIGLNHSCEGQSGSTGIPNCSDPSVDTLYLKAALYPQMLFDAQGMGEVRRTLNRNDQGRSNCLYDRAT